MKSEEFIKERAFAFFVCLYVCVLVVVVCVGGGWGKMDQTLVTNIAQLSPHRAILLKTNYVSMFYKQ